MLENLAEVLNTAAKMFLEEQQGMHICRLNSLLIDSSIVVFAKTLVLNHELANCVHILECWQMIGGTN